MRYVFFIAVLTGVLVSGAVCAWFFDYSGDGEYHSEWMIFPLRYQRLILPAFSLDEKRGYVYKVDGFGNEDQKLSLGVKSHEAIPFWKVTTLLEVEIQEKRSGKTVYLKKGRLNSHFQRRINEYSHYQRMKDAWIRAGRIHSSPQYQRMKDAQKALRANKDEWKGFYDYKEPGKPRVWSSEGFPGRKYLNQKKIRYYPGLGSGSPNIRWYKDYLVYVRVIEPDENFKNLEAQLKLSVGGDL